MWLLWTSLTYAMRLYIPYFFMNASTWVSVASSWSQMWVVHRTVTLWLLWCDFSCEDVDGLLLRTDRALRTDRRTYCTQASHTEPVTSLGLSTNGGWGVTWRSIAHSEATASPESPSQHRQWLWTLLAVFLCDSAGSLVALTLAQNSRAKGTPHPLGRAFLFCFISICFKWRSYCAVLAGLEDTVLPRLALSS